jgi:hypothetical protein
MSTDVKVYVGDDFAYGYKIAPEDTLLDFLKGSPEFVEVDKGLKIPLSGDGYNEETGFTYLNDSERYFNELVQESTVIAFIENGIVNRSMIYPHGVALNDAVIAALLSNPTFVFEE